MYLIHGVSSLMQTPLCSGGALTHVRVIAIRVWKEVYKNVEKRENLNQHRRHTQIHTQSSLHCKVDSSYSWIVPDVDNDLVMKSWNQNWDIKICVVSFLSTFLTQETMSGRIRCCRPDVMEGHLRRPHTKNSNRALFLSPQSGCLHGR